VSGTKPRGWPDGVKEIAIADLGRLGVDGGNQLYWDGRPVEIRKSLSLTRAQKWVAGIVTACAVLGGFGGFVTGFNNATVFLCARNIHWLSCPLPSAQSVAPSGTPLGRP
jgi:hypothetical protein